MARAIGGTDSTDSTLPREQTSIGKRLWTPVTRRILFFIVLLLIWEGIALRGIWPDYLLPSPVAVFNSLVGGIQDGSFINGTLVSLAHIAIGYSISLVVGVILGLLIGRVQIIGETVGSLVLGLQALPSICWFPIAILWFGLNDTAIIFVVVMGALFSITLGVDAGVRNTSPLYIKAARNMGASGVSLATQVILPAALPAILTGLKQGWSFAWRSLMAAELIYYGLSLGQLLNSGRDLNDIAQVMAIMAIIIFIGVTIDGFVFTPLEKRVRERWGLSG